MKCRQYFWRKSALILTNAAVLTLLAGLVWWLHPLMDHHEGTAAWVQAAGALLIIAATARVADRRSREAQERERKARQAIRRGVTVLARNCLDALDTLLKKCPGTAAPSDPRGTFLRSYARSDFDVPMDGLAAIPLHHIDDADLVTAVLNLRSIMGRIRKHLDDVAGDVLLSTTLEPVHALRTPAFNAVASTLRIVEGHAVEEELLRLAARA